MILANTANVNADIVTTVAGAGAKKTMLPP